jgi:hypothetical protein
MSYRRRLSLIWLALLAVAGCASAGVYFYTHRADSAASTVSSSAATEDPPVIDPTVIMDEAQGEYLWQIEHHGNVLTRDPHGFKALGRALSQADQPAITRLLAANFTGTTLGHPREEIRVANDFADVVREQPGKAPAAPLTGPLFVAELLKYRAMFSQPPKVNLALMGLRPVQPKYLDGPWQGSCQLRMWGQMGQDKPGEVVLVLKYEITRPTEEALAKGGWLHTGVFEQIQTARAPHFLMHEVAAKRGIDVGRFHDNWLKKPADTLTQTGGVYLCDFDRDGILDMLIIDTKDIALYKGQLDGSFREVTSEVGLPNTWENRRWQSPSIVAFVDIDGDGWEDLILGGRVYKNVQGKTFLDYTEFTNLRIPEDASAVAIADFDRDGRLDLYVARPGPGKAGDWLTGKNGDPERFNQLLRNKGNWQFENVTAKSGAGGGNRSCFSAVWLDANNDGWPDLYVINEFGNGVLLVNQGNGTFAEHQLGNGPCDFGTMGVTVGDIDNDGNIDIYCANMYSKAGNRIFGNVLPGTYPEPMMAKVRSFVAGSQLWRNRGGLQFEPMGKKYQVNACGWAYGAALVDLDNDGWLDLYATCGFVSQSRDEPDG